MPEIITTPQSLVQTNNGKRFYVNSGLVLVDNTETSVIDIANIGERDIRLNINVILTSLGADNIAMKVKNNGVTIYEAIWDEQSALHLTPLLKFIIPSNTSLDVTFENADGTFHAVGVSCYGKFV